MHINVLHLGHSKKWRGGENQVYLLIKGLNARHKTVVNHIAYPRGAMALSRLKDDVKGFISLPSKRAYDPRSIMKIVNYCKQNNIAIINAHSGNTHSLAYLVKLFLPNIKVVVHRRVDNVISTKWSTRKKYLSPKIDAWVAISAKIAQILKEYGVEDNKVRTIKSAINDEAYKNKVKSDHKKMICERYAINHSWPLIGFAGALGEHKQPLFFIKIIHELLRKGLKFNVLIAGDGPDKQALENYIEQNNLSNQVKTIGFIDDVSDFFSALDIFVLPSKNEGLGTVLLEAVHGGALVVASDVGGIPEIIKHGETGFLAKPQSDAEFCTAIEQMLLKPQRWERITKNALVHANEHFSHNALVDKTEALYQKLQEKTGD